MYIRIGVSDRKRILDISDIAFELGHDVYLALPYLAGVQKDCENKEFEAIDSSLSPSSSSESGDESDDREAATEFPLLSA